MVPPQSGFSLPSAAHLAVTHSFVGTSQWQHWGCFSPGPAPQWPPCPPSMWCHEHECPAKHLRCCSSHCVQCIEKHWHASLRFKKTHTHRARYNQTLFYCHPTPPIQHKYVTYILQYTIFSFFFFVAILKLAPLDSEIPLKHFFSLIWFTLNSWKAGANLVHFKPKIPCMWSLQNKPERREAGCDSQSHLPAEDQPGGTKRGTAWEEACPSLLLKVWHGDHLIRIRGPAIKMQIWGYPPRVHLWRWRGWICILPVHIVVILKLAN